MKPKLEMQKSSSAASLQAHGMMEEAHPFSWLKNLIFPSTSFSTPLPPLPPAPPPRRESARFIASERVICGLCIVPLGDNDDGIPPNPRTPPLPPGERIQPNPHCGMMRRKTRRAGRGKGIPMPSRFLGLSSSHRFHPPSPYPVHGTGHKGRQRGGGGGRETTAAVGRVQRKKTWAGLELPSVRGSQPVAVGGTTCSTKKPFFLNPKMQKKRPFFPGNLISSLKPWRLIKESRGEENEGISGEEG